MQIMRVKDRQIMCQLSSADDGCVRRSWHLFDFFLNRASE